jgi:2-methylcitrate dehydratase PrpD
MTESTAQLAEFAAGFHHQDMPDEVVLSTKLLLLDALACALAGHRGEATSQLRAVAQAFSPGAEDSTVVGGGRLSLAGAPCSGERRCAL